MTYHFNEALKKASDSMREETKEVKTFYYDSGHISRFPFSDCLSVNGVKLLELQCLMDELDAELENIDGGKDKAEKIRKSIKEMVEADCGLMDFYLDLEPDYPTIHIDLDESKVMKSYKRMNMNLDKAGKVRNRVALSRFLQASLFFLHKYHSSTFSDPRT